MKLFLPLLYLFLLANPNTSQAQDTDGGAKDSSGKNVGFEGGIFLGNLLPDQITGVSEITGLGGARAGYRLGPGTFAEAAFATGNGDGVEWKNFDLDVRMDIPVETLVVIADIGPDVTYYKGNGTSRRMIFGVHVGGGIQTMIGCMTWFRADMKFAASPGTSLFISFGFVFRFPGGGSGGGGA